MPGKKRTEQSKRTPPTSPTTSTSYASADQHHRLRHTGPSISTRSSVAAASSKPAPAPTHLEVTRESPSPEEGSHEKKLPPPSARTSFTKSLYVLLIVVLLLFGWYIYGAVTLLERLKEEVGWWGIIVGDSAETTRWETCEGCGFGSNWAARTESGRAEPEKGGQLEGSLNALAHALGISPIQVASAVKSLIPQASLTSIASKTEATGDPEAIRVLFEDTTPGPIDRDRVDETWIGEEFAEK